MTKKRTRSRPSHARANKSAHELIELMLAEMHAAMRDPERMETPEWQRLFGNKQSFVVNLLKLVQALGVLPDDEGNMTKKAKKEEAQSQKLSPEEMAILTTWLKEGQEEGA